VAATFYRFHDEHEPVKQDNWTNDTAQSYGRILFPPENARLRGSHSVCITGFVPDETTGGGYFTFRNSWGSRWGKWPGHGNSYTSEAGYGDMSAKYVDYACWEILQL
jgi:C1A family cysteine protease